MSKGFEFLKDADFGVGLWPRLADGAERRRRMVLQNYIGGMRDMRGIMGSGDGLYENDDAMRLEVVGFAKHGLAPVPIKMTPLCGWVGCLGNL